MEKLQAYGDPGKLDAITKALSDPANSVADLIKTLSGMQTSGHYDQQAILKLISLKERVLNTILLQTMKIGRNCNDMTRD